MAAIQISGLVTERRAFVVNHLRGRDVASYTLRSGGRVCVRHRTSDPLVLQEVFATRAYSPPAGLAARVAAHRGPIVDLGANIGVSALWLRRVFPGQLLTAFEPDPANLSLLDTCMALNSADWRIVRAAASNRDGELAFHGGQGWESRLDPAGKVKVDAIDVFPYLRGAAMLKMDIEGGEWDILSDPRFATVGVPVVVLEHHAHGCPSDEPRAAAIAALEGAGYAVYPGQEHDEGTGILWAAHHEDFSAGADQGVPPRTDHGSEWERH